MFDETQIKIIDATTTKKGYSRTTTKNIATGNIEASFSSKMLATINPDMPIWDRYVVQNLCLNIKGKTKEDQLKCAVDLYDQMLSWYADFLQTENGRDCIVEFDRTLPGYVWMSDVKKIDFYLWSIRD